MDREDVTSTFRKAIADSAHLWPDPGSPIMGYDPIAQSIFDVPSRSANATASDVPLSAVDNAPT